MAITSIKTGSSFTNLQKYDTFLGPNAAYNPSSFESIASVTAAGGETSLTFSSIPSTYKHLQIRMTHRDTAAGTSINIVRYTFNSDSGSNYSIHFLRGDGSTVSAGAATSNTFGYFGRFPYDGNTANVFGTAIMDIQDYSSTTKNKTVRVISGVDTNGTGGIDLDSNAWYSTSVINTIAFTPNGTAFKAGSTFSLYGIKGA